MLLLTRLAARLDQQAMLIATRGEFALFPVRNPFPEEQGLTATVHSHRSSST